MRLNPSHYLATAVVLSVSTKAASSASSSTPDLHPSEVSGAAQSGPLSWLWPFQRSTPSKSPSNNFALPDDVVLRGTPAASVLRRHSSAHHRRRIHP
ncbi:hypothetical protein H2248_003770 [Termitomyces sp. 'cryptogamus']|nr:hypothetical protein H2248_003770 [Termitomyces sp. 'cryptogamus']